MKQRKLALIVIFLMLAIAEYKLPSTKAQTAEPSKTPAGCYVDPAVIWNVAFSPDGRYLIANWPPHSVRIWDVQSGAIVATLTDNLIDSQEQFFFSPNNEYVITGGNTSIVILWNVSTGEKVRTFRSKKYKIGHINAMAFSLDGDSILVASGDGNSLWDLASGAEDTHLSMEGEGGNFSEFSPDGNLILTQSAGSQVRIWDKKSGELLHTFNDERGETGDYYRIMFSPDGKYILIPRRQETILSDAKTFRTVHSLSAGWSDWQFSTNGKYLLAVKKPGTAFLWDVETGKLLNEFEAATGYAIKASFLNGQSILIPKPLNIEHQTIVSIHDLETGDELKEVVFDIPLIAMQVSAVAPDGKYLAIASYNNIATTIVTNIVTLWDIQTGKRIRQYC